MLAPPLYDDTPNVSIPVATEALVAACYTNAEKAMARLCQIDLR
jgi:hypothetical protein